MSQPSLSTRTWPKWLLSALSVVLTLGILEAGFRIYLFTLAPARKVSKYGRAWDIPLERQFFLPHPYLIYSLNPDYRSEDGLNRHNALGYRGDDFPRQKPQGIYRIACLGGSSTYSTSVNDYRLSFPDQLERVLHEQYGREEVHVINAGVPGYNSWESLINLQLRVLDLSPDLIVIYHGTNDVHARLVPPERYVRDGTGHRKPMDAGLYGWWDHSLLLRYLGIRLGFSETDSLGNRTKQRYPKDMDLEASLDRNPPTYFADNLHDMIVLARAHGAEVLLSSWAHRPTFGDYASETHYQRGFAENNEVVREVAARNGALFYDLAAEMPADDGLWSDGRHVNERGARKKAELFAAFIERHVLAPRERPRTAAQKE